MKEKLELESSNESLDTLKKDSNVRIRVRVPISMPDNTFICTCANNKLLPFIFVSLYSFREDPEEERRLNTSRTKASRSLAMRTRSRKVRAVRDC